MPVLSHPYRRKPSSLIHYLRRPRLLCPYPIHIQLSKRRTCHILHPSAECGDDRTTDDAQGRDDRIRFREIIECLRRSFLVSAHPFKSCFQEPKEDLYHRQKPVGNGNETRTWNIPMVICFFRSKQAMTSLVTHFSQVSEQKSKFFSNVSVRVSVYSCSVP